MKLFDVIMRQHSERKQNKTIFIYLYWEIKHKNNLGLLIFTSRLNTKWLPEHAALFMLSISRETTPNEATRPENEVAIIVNMR